MLVYGHRGARAYAPMNTYAAYDRAFEQGADGIELDVWLSRDGVPVVLHDEHVDATTDGAGSIREMTLDQIQRLDAGSWFAPEFAGQRIPTLRGVLERYVGRRMNIEIKAPGDGEPAETDGVEAAVAGLIAEFGVEGRVIVSSFSRRVLERFQALMPQAPTGYLFILPPDPDDPWLAACDALHPYHEAIDADFVQRFSRWRINTWTVNDPDLAVELSRLGVNTVITDCPDVLISRLRA